MISVYLCGVSVIIAAAIGIPVGHPRCKQRANAPGGASHRRHASDPAELRLSDPGRDAVPGGGNSPPSIAIVLYALAPAIRYTDHGLRGISPDLIEAAKMSGCRPWQTLTKVKLPLAMPAIMLGVNQTIMMALSMLVITALVGTNDLGQEVYIALTRADIGHGIVAGVCVAFIAMVADRLIGAWADRRKRLLGQFLMEER